jgi:transposase
MSRKLRIAPHLNVDEVGVRYRQAKDAVERSHWQILWLLMQGDATAEVARVTRYSVAWVRQVVHRYNAQGAEGLRDERHTNPGRRALLTHEQEEELDQALDHAAPDGGLWTSPKVAQWISARIGRRVGKQRGWAYLQRLHRRPKVPRPRHILADATEQEPFIKKTS